MYNSRRCGSSTHLHNASTFSTSMRAMATSALPSNYPHRHLSRSKTSISGTQPFRSSSIHQVGNRDRETERVHHGCDSVRSVDLFALEAKVKNYEKVIARKNAENEHLIEQKCALERRLQEVMDDKRDLSYKEHEERLKNDDLLRDLKDIDRLARKVQADRQFTVEAADRELTEAKMEIEQCHHEMQALDNKVAHLTIDKKNLIEELDTTKSQYITCRAELARLQEFVDRLQADKTKLTRRISKLVQNEKDLLLELQKCRRSTKPLVPSASTGSLTKKLAIPTRLELHLKNVEDERDMYKNEVETLQRLLNERPSCLSSSFLRGRSLSPTNTKRSTLKRDRATSPVMQYIKRSTSSCATSPTRCSVCGLNRNRLSPTKDINSYETQLKCLEEERDQCRRELRKYKRSFQEKTKEDLQKARHELLQNAQTTKVSQTAQAILRKVEDERDTAIAEARAAASERDSLRERLYMATDSGAKERARYEQRIADLEIDLQKLDSDRDELIQRNHVLHQEIKILENKINEQSFTIMQLKQESNDCKTESAELRGSLEEAGPLLEEHHLKLKLKTEEIHNLEDKISQLEKKIYELQEKNKAITNDFHIVRLTAQTYEKEKDRLSNEVDSKSDENLRLSQDISTKIRQIEELSMTISELEAALDRAKDETKQKLKDITNIRLQADRTLEEVNEYRRKHEHIARDNKRLQEDIFTLTGENQTLRQQLERATDEKENFRSQITEYIKQVSNCESVITQKEQDRTNLVDQYRETSNELHRAQITLSDMESQVNCLKQELQMKSTETKRLTDRVDYLERELQQQTSLGKEYEIQLSNMNRTLQRNEDMMKKLQSDKQNLLNDFSNVRDLNSTLELKKEQLVRQLTSKEIECEQLQSALNEMKAEIDTLRAALANEKSALQRSEELIESLHGKEFQMQLEGRERDADLRSAKDRAHMNEHKLQNQTKEIASLKTQILALETDNKRLRSLLANERIEREKAAQDLRKLSDLTSHINFESQYRCVSPNLTTSASCTNIHRSPPRTFSPPRTETPRGSPTKISISLKLSEVDKTHEIIPQIDVSTNNINSNNINYDDNAMDGAYHLYLGPMS